MTRTSPTSSANPKSSRTDRARTLRRVISVGLALALAGISTNSLATHSWGGYHWARTANPFTLKLGDNVTSAWDGHLGATSVDWSVSTVLDTTIVPGAAGKPKRCASTNGRVEVCNALYGNNGWLGVAQIWASGTHITRGTVKVNDTYFNTATYNTSAWRQMVMCQEVGHTLGLDHQDESFSNPNLGTCMDYTNNPDSNQHPNKHDYDQLVSIYTHLDSTNTTSQSTSLGAMPREMIDVDHGERAQWGALVRSRNNGLREVYRRDFGGGYTLTTFVIWAEGEGRGRR